MAGTGDALSAVADAVLGIAGDLSIDVVLERLVHEARALAGARYAALGVPDGEGGFDRFITAGMTDAEIEAMGPLPRTHGLLAAMLDDPAPFRTDDITADPRFRGWWPATHPRMRSFLGVPIVFKGDVIGAFYLTDKEGVPAFDAGDEETVGVLAAHAAVLMEHARLYEESRELSVLGERNRLARELHDAMTQTLFSLRLTLETGDLDTARGLVETLFAELKGLVGELRPPAVERDGLVGALAKHLDVVSRAHGVATAVGTSGHGALAPEVEAQLFRIAQEAASNAVRHGRPSRVDVAVDLGPDEVTLTVADDGTGFDPAARAVRSRRLGLTSMRERAASLGGRLTVTSAPGQGTTVRAVVPRA
ncbi:MAG TPA: GAF domain-containing sensor histidine kinase [Acidimicrobiales bacterium]|nr:GAF domain-containing sensor histidine kinase [Acidimicrobiales bacterium]